jgi:predicted amidohydrolase YtcJ
MTLTWKHGLILGTLLTALLIGCDQPDEPDFVADLVLMNGKIVTVDSLQPEVEALAVAGDTLVALGSSDEMAVYIGPATQVIDLEGRLAIPGFIEGHGHYMSLGRS